MHQDHEPATEATVDVACVGETMALLVPEAPPAGDESPGAPPDGWAPRFRLDIGGAESNVAVHLARFGHRVAWHSALGEDAFGHHITDRLTREGVGCVVRTEPEHPTGLYVKELGAAGTVVRYYRTGSAASTLAPEDARALWRLRPRLVHTTGITAALSPQAADLVRHLLRGAPRGVLRSFDVNYRPALHGERGGTRGAPEHATALRDTAQCADVVFCGLDEATALWGTTTVAEVRELLDQPELLVIKEGARGATAIGPSGTHVVPAPEVEVVEPVGAGDAFAAGVLHGLLSQDTLMACLDAGARLAGTVLGVDGDVPPAPSTGGLSGVQ